MKDLPSLYITRAHNKAVEAIKKIDDGHEDLKESIEYMDRYFDSPYTKYRPRYFCVVGHTDECPIGTDQSDEFNEANPPTLMLVLEDCTCSPLVDYLRSIITKEGG